MLHNTYLQKCIREMKYSFQCFKKKSNTTPSNVFKPM